MSYSNGMITFLYIMIGILYLILGGFYGLKLEKINKNGIQDIKNEEEKNNYIMFLSIYILIGVGYGLIGLFHYLHHEEVIKTSLAVKTV